LRLIRGGRISSKSPAGHRVRNSNLLEQKRSHLSQRYDGIRQIIDTALALSSSLEVVNLVLYL
jgi:hypothetical protein